MPFELINSLASVGTFAVIAASAIAAMVQLRHLRMSNQIALMTKLQETLQSADFVEARRFIASELAEMLRDPRTVENLHNPPFTGQMRALGVIGNFYEAVGQFVRRGMLDRAVLCESWGGIIVQTWAQVAPALAIIRRDQSSGQDIWENFEYLAVISEDWRAHHPGGNYPKQTRRMVLPALPDEHNPEPVPSRAQHGKLAQELPMTQN